MKKTFCDCCADEIPDVRPERLSGQSRRGKYVINFEIMTGLNEPNQTGISMNNGDICKYCIIDAVNTLDDRPVAEGPRS